MVPRGILITGANPHTGPEGSRSGDGHHVRAVSRHSHVGYTGVYWSQDDLPPTRAWTLRSAPSTSLNTTPRPNIVCSSSCFAGIGESTVWPTALHVPAFVVGSTLMSTPASRNGSMRAADTDRIQVAQLLTDAAAQGQLQMSEYEDRLTRAYAAQTYDELDRISADLPGAVTRARNGAPCRPAPSTLLLAIMSGFERRGRWNVPKRLTTVALFGGGVVDLRYADFTSPEVEIHSYSIMGGQTILVPPEVNVDLRGVAVMGTFDQSVNGQGSPGAPHVRIRGFSLWGSVGVKRKKRKAI